MSATYEEITHRFPQDRRAVQQLAGGNEQLAADVFKRLSQGRPEGWLIVAYWVTSKGEHRSYPVQAPAGLAYVVEGVHTNHCLDLRFFFIPQERVPSHPAGYRELFQ